MKSSLRFHICRMSNSVESSYNVFYTLIRGGRPLCTTLRQALKLAKSDQDDLSQFYEYGTLTTYNRHPRLRKSRKKLEQLITQKVIVVLLSKKHKLCQYII